MRAFATYRSSIRSANLLQNPNSILPTHSCGLGCRIETRLESHQRCLMSSTAMSYPRHSFSEFSVLFQHCPENFRRSIFRHTSAPIKCSPMYVKGEHTSSQPLQSAASNISTWAGASFTFRRLTSIEGNFPACAPRGYVGGRNLGYTLLDVFDRSSKI